MNILVTLDSNYIDKLITMLNSLADSNSGDFDIYIAHSSLTPCDFLTVIQNTDTCRITLHPIRISDNLFKNAHFTSRITKETYYRLLLFEYLPITVDRILYLDPDIIVLNSVEPLYNIDFKDKIFAAAGHTGGVVKKFNLMRLNMGKKSEYINAGVLMINVAAMRNCVDAESIFGFIGSKGRLLFQADQDVINALFWDKTIYLDPCIFNCDEHTFQKYLLNLKWVQKNSVIIHYDGKNKPWNDDYSGSLGVFYKKYAGKVRAYREEVSA